MDKRAQKQLNLSSPHLEKLSPFKDERDIIRIYGRINRMTMFDMKIKHPVLLTKGQEISMRIVKQVHDKCFHPGHLLVMAEFRKKYWIVGVRTLAKLLVEMYVICRKWRGSSLDQKMADLPSFRLTPGYPFESTAIDYFGPIDIK